MPINVSGMVKTIGTQVGKEVRGIVGPLATVLHIVMRNLSGIDTEFSSWGPRRNVVVLV